jgi:hypothetical protein
MSARASCAGGGADLLELAGEDVDDPLLLGLVRVDEVLLALARRRQPPGRGRERHRERLAGDVCAADRGAGRGQGTGARPRLCL